MNALLLNPADDVAVATARIPAGETVEAGTRKVVAQNDIPKLHKIALRDIPSGEHVRKYGYSIGISLGIRAGEHVHTHNLRSGLRRSDCYEYSPKTVPAATYPKNSFEGYRRKDGRVGIRNQILVLPTVGCINNVCEEIARVAREKSGYKEIYAMPHPYGCSQLGDDLQATQNILAGLASNPNNGGVLVVSLGCENNRLEDFFRCLQFSDTARLRTLRTQDEGNEIEKGTALACELAEICKADQRTSCFSDDLIVGLKCGGSDAFSGITANPSVGVLTDRLIGMGGSAVMTEIPEMFGAEQLLLDRCVSKEKFDDLAKLIQDFKRYFTDHDESVGENPSPGNKEGGITTLEEKSLGCVLKGGHAAVCDVLRYGTRVRERGLTVLEAPGNDATAQTALAAAGAQLVLFTTGRGTPLGGIVPPLKISTNTALASAKPHWIDFDAGRAEKIGVTETAEELMRLVIETANGKTTAAENNRSREIAVWKRGVTL